jgi:hypothetical protein
MSKEPEPEPNAIERAWQELREDLAKFKLDGNMQANLEEALALVQRAIAVDKFR